MIAAQLDELPESVWNERLAEVRRYVRLPLAIASAADVPRRVSSLSAQKPVFVRAEIGPPSIYIPLHAGHTLWWRSPTTATTTAAHAASRRSLDLRAGADGNGIGRGRDSSRSPAAKPAERDQRIGSGNWAVRLDANAEGGLSDLAESINRTAAQLQQQFQEREALLQVVSHEIGTPLSRMRFQVGMLEDEIQRPNQRNRLRALGDDLDELDELSTELVAWMEPDSTRVPSRATSSSNRCWSRWWNSRRSEKARAQPITLMVPANDVVRRSAPVPESHRESPAQRLRYARTSSSKCGRCRRRRRGREAQPAERRRATLR